MCALLFKYNTLNLYNLSRSFSLFLTSMTLAAPSQSPPATSAKAAGRKKAWSGATENDLSVETHDMIGALSIRGPGGCTIHS